VKPLRRDLRDNQRHQQRQKHRRSGQITPVQGHRHGIAAGFAEGRGGYFYDPEGESYFRDFAQYAIACVVHAVAHISLVTEAQQGSRSFASAERGKGAPG
jgi:hypothetical protein